MAVSDLKKDGSEFSAQETAKRRDEALRRAMMTPPNPHKPIGKKKASPKRKSASAKPKTA